jgi:hypothetical protein
VGSIETADFRGDDVDALVAASLACSGCLSGDVDWALDGASFDPSVRVACRGCGHVRRVFLQPMQALRLHLHSERPLDRSVRPASSLAARR